MNTTRRRANEPAAPPGAQVPTRTGGAYAGLAARDSPIDRPDCRAEGPVAVSEDEHGGGVSILVGDIADKLSRPIDTRVGAAVAVEVAQQGQVARLAEGDLNLRGAAVVRGVAEEPALPVDAWIGLAVSIHIPQYWDVTCLTETDARLEGAEVVPGVTEEDARAEKAEIGPAIAVYISQEGRLPRLAAKRISDLRIASRPPGVAHQLAPAKQAEFLAGRRRESLHVDVLEKIQGRSVRPGRREGAVVRKADLG